MELDQLDRFKTIGNRIGSIRQCEWHETSILLRVKNDEIFGEIAACEQENSKVWTRPWEMELVSRITC